MLEAYTTMRNEVDRQDDYFTAASRASCYGFINEEQLREDWLIKFDVSNSNSKNN